MANCHDLFQIYVDRITPGQAKQQYLRDSRDAIRDKIRKHFKDELKRSQPRFWGQGSYAMKTLIVPLSGEYDIDDGVYLSCLDKDRKKWETCEKVHEWVCAAVKGHTDTDPVDKDTCVRVIYARRYHVDLPIYGEDEDKYYLAEKGAKGWHTSDPRAIVQWFRDEAKAKGEQLRRIIKYIKGWADFKSNEAKMPSSLLLTVLGTNNYEALDNDDACFSRVIKNIYTSIDGKFEVLNPVDEEEVLSDRLSETQKEIFKVLLKAALDHAAKALKEENKKEASKIWQKVFGDRFPLGEDEEKKKVFTSGPAILKDDARSA